MRQVQVTLVNDTRVNESGERFIYQGRTFIKITSVNPYIELYGGNTYWIRYSVNYLELVL